MSPGLTILDPALIGVAGATVGATWEDDFTSDNWSSDSGSNYIDTTNNLLIRDDNASIWFELPFTPETSSVDGQFVVTFGYNRVSNGWASQSYFGMCTHSNFKYNSLADNNQWMGFCTNDWDTATRLQLNAKYGGTEVESWGTNNGSSLSTADTMFYCKFIFDAVATNPTTVYFFSDEDMTTPLDIGGITNRVCPAFPSNWSDSDYTWYLFSSGYAGYASTQEIAPIKFYNGVNDI